MNRHGRQRSTLLAWSALLLCLGLCLPPLLIGLDQRPSTHTMEHIAVLSSQETWLRHHDGDQRAWLMPTNNSIFRIVKPPLLVWLNLAAWSDLTPPQAPPQTLIHRARLVSVATGMLMLTATFWLGHSIGGNRLAVIATLAAGAIFFLQRQARTASYDIEFTAWATLALAAAIWAIAPTQPAISRSRWWCGWILCGFCLGLSWMTKNPLALLIVVPPLLAAILLFPRAGRAPWLGLALSLAVSLLVVAPWHLYVFSIIPDAAAILKHEFRQPRGGDRQPYWYYLSIFALVFPWTILLIAGLYHPWDRAWRTVCSGQPAAIAVRFWPLVWFIFIAVFFSLVEAKQQRYILPIIAPAALLIARVWCDHASTRASINIPLLARPHWFLLLISALGMILAGIALAVGWQLPFSLQDAIPIQPPILLITAAALLALAAWGWALHERGHILHAASITAAWALIATIVFWHGYSQQPTPMDRVIESAQRLRQITGTSPVASLAMPDHRGVVEEEFRMYFNGFIKPLTPDRITADSIQWVVAQPREPHRSILDSLGYRLVTTVHESPDTTLECWTRSTSDPSSREDNP